MPLTPGNCFSIPGRVMDRHCGSNGSSGQSWDQGAAKAWWEKHLVELTGPLSMTDRSNVDAPPIALALR